MTKKTKQKKTLGEKEQFSQTIYRRERKSCLDNLSEMYFNWKRGKNHKQKSLRNFDCAIVYMRIL